MAGSHGHQNRHALTVGHVGCLPKPSGLRMMEGERGFAVVRDAEGEGVYYAYRGCALGFRLPPSHGEGPVLCPPGQPSQSGKAGGARARGSGEAREGQGPARPSKAKAASPPRILRRRASGPFLLPHRFALRGRFRDGPVRAADPGGPHQEGRLRPRSRGEVPTQVTKVPKQGRKK